MKVNTNKKKLNKNMVSIPRLLKQNLITLDVELTQAIYLRTGQTSSSFSSGSQVHSLNLNLLVAQSNNLQKFVTSSVTNVELVRISGYSMKWYPSTINAISGTFEPAAFDIRHINYFSSDSNLPSGYYGNYNEAQYAVLLQQTARPVTTVFSLPPLPTVLSETNYPCIGQYINGYTFFSAPSQLGGIISIIQTTPSVNSVALYSPKLGFLELRFHVELYNSIV